MAADIGNNSHKRENLTFQRTVPSVEVSAVASADIGFGEGVSAENVTFGYLGASYPRQR